MEQQDISLSYGIRRSPSIGSEGELSECVNLIPRNGELVNIQPPKALGITLPSGARLVFVHRTTSFVHYLYITSTNALCYTDGAGATSELEGTYADLLSIQNVGNTLICLTERGMFYYLWDVAADDYKYIGTKPPFPVLAFGLKGEFVKTDWVELDMPEKNYVRDPSNPLELSENNLEYANTALMGMVSKFIREESTEKNRFLYPFFIRYAYRLYDGTTTMLSAPILMIPSSGITPFAVYKPKPVIASFVDAYFGYDTCIAAVLCGIDYSIDGLDSSARNWTDIVKSIDIFISEPIYTFDYNGEITGLEVIDTESYPDFGIFKLDDNPGYKKYTFYEMANLYIESEEIEVDGQKFSNGRFILPKKEITDMNLQNSQFYKIASISYEDACTQSNPNTRRDLVMDNFVFDSLNNRERLDDATGYQTLDELRPTYGYTYNSRLNLANIRRVLFNGYPLSSMICFSSNNSNVATADYSVRTFIREGDKEIVVASDVSAIDAHAYYLFYPNTNAYKMEVVNQTAGTVATVALAPHPLLNGAYYFSSFDELSYTSKSPTSATQDRTVDMPNKIYTSEVNNPFYFPLGGINTVGTGEIMGIRSTTKALSQGQFGQFPLYAFSTDGIWALEISDTGLYSSVQPVSRDVCNNPEAITQLDAAIIFTTEGGLKLITGSEVSLLSAQMEGRNTDETDYNVSPDFSSLFVPDTELFADTLRTCRMAYDYANALVHIYPSEGTKHYVYSLQSGEYSTFVGDSVVATVADYPTTVVQIGTALYAMERYTSDEIRKGIAITRALTLGDPFALKMLCDLRTLGQRTTTASKIRIAVFASNDREQWYRLPSLRQRSFKFYRFVYFTWLADVDTLSGTRVVFERRRDGKLR